MNYIQELRQLVGTRPLILPSTFVIILDEQGRILMQQRHEPYGSWGVPGGFMEAGESFEECARREVLEETGLIVEELELLGLLSGQEFSWVGKNGDVTHSAAAIFLARSFSGELRRDEEESLDLHFYPLDELPAYMPKPHIYAIECYKKYTKFS